MTKHEARSTKHENISNFEFRYSNFHASRGYTLIEMLISVAIFSGLLIIVLGAVASSSSSSTKVSSLREKSQAARAIIDQISNDLRYVDRSISLKVGNQLYPGYWMSADYLHLIVVMRFPNPTSNSGYDIVSKKYDIEVIDNRRTVRLIEGRNCTPNDRNQLDPAQDCLTRSTTPTDLLSLAYALNGGNNSFPSEFGGVMIGAAQAEQPPISPFVSMVFSLKPADLALNCADLRTDSGSCYKVSTAINVGTL